MQVGVVLNAGERRAPHRPPLRVPYVRPRRLGCQPTTSDCTTRAREKFVGISGAGEFSGMAGSRRAGRIGVIRGRR